MNSCFAKLRRLAPLVAILALAAGCNDDKPAVSLDEARRITASFQGQGFTPPPRTISDIAAILDQEKPDPAKIAKFREAADRQPPADLKGGNLATFYYNRAVAAGEIGRGQQRLADLRQAEQIASASPGEADYMHILSQLSMAEIRQGNLRAGREVRIRAQQYQENQVTLQGRLFGAYAHVATMSTVLGDLETARTNLAKAERLYGQAQGWKSFPLYGPTWHALVLDAQTYTLEASGEYAAAEQAARVRLREIDRAIASLPRWDSPPPPPGTFEQWRDTGHRDIARLLMKQGRLVEAEVEIRKALMSQLQRRGRYAGETADFVGNFADLLMEQRRYDEAGRLVDVALEIYKTTAHEPGSVNYNLARLRKARVLNSEGKFAEALELFRAVGRDLGPAEREQYVSRNMAYAVAALRTGNLDEARRVLEAAVERRQQQLGPNHYDTAEARGFLGVALAAAGDRSRALENFKPALPILMAPSRQVADEAGSGDRDRRLKFILEGYIGLLADVQGTALAAQVGADPAAEAFRMAEAARARGVTAALAASSARAAAKDPSLADLVRREQDAQKQIAALYALLTSLLATPSDQQDAQVITGLRTQIDNLRGARAALREEIERRFPDYANLIDPRPPSVDDARAALAPGEALLATYVGEDRVFSWAVPKSGAIAFAASKMSRAEVGRAVRDMRRALDPNASTLGDVPKFDVALAHRFYQAVLQPVEAGWRDAKSLLIVPDAALGQLPFGLLVTAPHQLRAERDGEALFAAYRDVPWLIRKVAVTQLPSVNSLMTLRRVPAATGARKPFVGFGDPWFSKQQELEAQAGAATQVAELAQRGARSFTTRSLPLVRRSAPTTQTVDSAELAQLPRLPDTAEEVKSVAIALKADPAADVFVGKAANERNVKTLDLSDRKVVMFATHGLVPGDLNGLTQPALALSAPNVADVDGDGLLTIDEILALRLNADWVVLSACNTATGEGAGAEAVSGLGRAFFYAGTRALLVSNWPVETTSARALTIDLFRRQAEDATLGRAEALRRAMTGLIDGKGALDPVGGRTLFSYAHPIFWAPFSLVGDGGGGQAGS